MEPEQTLRQLAALLNRVGEFPRPQGRPGYRWCEHDPYAHEGHDGIVLEGVREDAPELGRTRWRTQLRAGAPAPDGCTELEREPNPIDERIAAVRPIRQQLEELVPPLLNRGALPNPAAWEALLDDDVLGAETVRACRESLPDHRSILTVREPAHDDENGDTQTKVDRAIALLMRDVRNGDVRSARAYCRDVGIPHASTLTRHASWKAAQAGAAKATTRDKVLASTKDADGKLEAWHPVDPCENCGDADPKRGPLLTRVCDGQAVHLCETCAREFSPR